MRFTLSLLLCLFFAPSAFAGGWAESGPLPVFRVNLGNGVAHVQLCASATDCSTFQQSSNPDSCDFTDSIVIVDDPATSTDELQSKLSMAMTALAGGLNLHIWLSGCYLESNGSTRPEAAALYLTK